MQPNILWVSFEDTNPFYGCYGDPVARTPHLDRLAADGCRYTHAFSTAGVCAPARSAIITGMYAISIGTHHMRTTHTNPDAPELPTPYSAVIPAHVRCFTEYLRAAGYYCTNNAKTDYQFTPPITAWDELGSEAHWRHRPDPEQPFFAVFNPTRTHESGMWPENCPDPDVDPARVPVPPVFPDTPKVRLALARMYTHIQRSDAELGSLLAQLEEDGLAENTIVCHWSDHGPLPRGKRWPYDSGIRVPLIIRRPGKLEPGSVSDRLISSVDLGPTMLSVAGVPIPHHIQGRAFLGGAEAAAREVVFASRDRHDEAYDRVRAARDRRFKYIRHYRPELPYLLWIPYRNRHPILQELYRLHGAGELSQAQEALFRPRPPEELYDTEADPWETDNLAGDPAHRVDLERLRGAVDGWIADVGDMGAMPEAEMVRRWYPDGIQPSTAAPVFVPICEENTGASAVTGEVELDGPALLQIACATEGASIAFTVETGRPETGPRWLLYTGPIRLARGRTAVRARAVRIGYKDSAEKTLAVMVR